MWLYKCIHYIYSRWAKFDVKLVLSPLRYCRVREGFTRGQGNLVKFILCFQLLANFGLIIIDRIHTRGGRERGREGEREGGKEGGREGRREGGREGEKEGGGIEGGREEGREGGIFVKKNCNFQL